MGLTTKLPMDIDILPPDRQDYWTIGVVIMNVIILQAEILNLPEPLAVKLRGKKVELIENGDTTITIRPVQCVIDAACGMLKSDGHAVDRFMTEKRQERELEYGN